MGQKRADPVLTVKTDGGDLAISDVLSHEGHDRVITVYPSRVVDQEGEPDAEGQNEYENKDPG